MIQLKNNQVSKIMIGMLLVIMLFLYAIPVSAKTCSYAYDPAMAIGYGNINIEKGVASINPYTYSAYVLGTDPEVVKNIAFYSVGEGGGTNNVLGRTIMHMGSVQPGTTRSTNKSSVKITLYHNTTQKASVSDSI